MMCQSNTFDTVYIKRFLIVNVYTIFAHGDVTNFDLLLILLYNEPVSDYALALGTEGLSSS